MEPIELPEATLKQMVAFGFAEERSPRGFYMTEAGHKWLNKWLDERLTERAKLVTQAAERLKTALDEHLPEEVWNHELKGDFATLRNWAEVHARKYIQEG
jgi:DNA-binding PadR family transcriptional regulator